MTLSVLEGHNPIANLFKCDISYLWHTVHSLCYAEHLLTGRTATH